MVIKIIRLNYLGGRQPRAPALSIRISEAIRAVMAIGIIRAAVVRVIIRLDETKYWGTTKYWQIAKNTRFCTQVMLLY